MASTQADVEKKRLLIYRQQLFHNRREVLLGQVLINLGIMTPEQVFPAGLPDLPPPVSFKVLEEESKKAAERSYLEDAFANLKKRLQPPPQPARSPEPVKQAKSTLQVDMSDVPFPTHLNLDQLDPKVRKDIGKFNGPVDGIIKRLEVMVQARDDYISLKEVPCAPERTELMKCYTATLTAAYQRASGGGQTEPNERVRPGEVLGCSGPAEEFIRCAAISRLQWLDKEHDF
eukprot:Sspe_Gene.103035::Locus_78875_Transcript_2_2_Confidence_0.667_Length_827::g.103035::m.103035